MAKQRRTPPDPVQETLRREVNYVCPYLSRVTGQACGKPFLTFHHFDPTWRERNHHEPEGMISLCREHADEADGDLISKSDLRSWKRQELEPLVQYPWPWTPDPVVFLVGGNLIVAETPSFIVGDRPALSISRHRLSHRVGAALMFNSQLHAPTGERLLSLKNNALTFLTSNVSECKFTTQKKEFVFRHTSGAALGARCDYLDTSSLKARLEREAMVGKQARTARESALAAAASVTNSDGKTPVVTITGKFHGHGCWVKVTPRKALMKIDGYSETALTNTIIGRGGSLNIVTQDQRPRTLLRFGDG